MLRYFNERFFHAFSVREVKPFHALLSHERQDRNFTAAMMAMAVVAPRSARDAPKIIVRPTATMAFEALILLKSRSYFKSVRAVVWSLNCILLRSHWTLSSLEFHHGCQLSFKQDALARGRGLSPCKYCGRNQLQQNEYI